MLTLRSVHVLTKVRITKLSLFTVNSKRNPLIRLNFIWLCVILY